MRIFISPYQQSSRKTSLLKQWMPGKNKAISATSCQNNSSGDNMPAGIAKPERNHERGVESWLLFFIQPAQEITKLYLFHFHSSSKCPDLFVCSRQLALFKSILQICNIFFGFIKIIEWNFFLNLQFHLVIKLKQPFSKCLSPIIFKSIKLHCGNAMKSRSTWLLSHTDTLKHWYNSALLLLLLQVNEKSSFMWSCLPVPAAVKEVRKCDELA